MLPRHLYGWLCVELVIFLNCFALSIQVMSFFTVFWVPHFWYYESHIHFFGFLVIYLFIFYIYISAFLSTRKFKNQASFSIENYNNTGCVHGEFVSLLQTTANYKIYPRIWILEVCLPKWSTTGPACKFLSKVLLQALGVTKFCAVFHLIRQKNCK